jgi:hypothetical protein
LIIGAIPPGLLGLFMMMSECAKVGNLIAANASVSFAMNGHYKLDAPVREGGGWPNRLWS